MGVRVRKPSPHFGGSAPPPQKRLYRRTASSGVGPAKTYTTTPPAGTETSTESERGNELHAGPPVVRSTTGGLSFAARRTPRPTLKFTYRDESINTP